jgi:hypothetical protein
VNKKVSVITLVLLAISLMPYSLVSTAQATIMEENHYGPSGAGFTEYYGSIGGQTSLF